MCIACDFIHARTHARTHTHIITANYSSYRQAEVARLREQLAAPNTIPHPPGEDTTQTPQPAATKSDGNIGRTTVSSKADTIPPSLQHSPTHQSTSAPPTPQVLLVSLLIYITATL